MIAMSNRISILAKSPSSAVDCHIRAESMSSNVLPRRALMSRMIVRRHRSREPQ